MRTICLFFVFAALLAAADVTGAWTGTVVVTDPSSGEKISTNVKAQLAQKSGAVTGKIGREHDDELETIRDGKVSGNVVVFAVQPAEATTPMQFTLTLVTPDRIEGDMKGAIDTGNISGKVVLTRAKP